MTLLLQIIGICFGLGLLIFIHELGHFSAAKMCGVRILTFSFGFGPDLLKYVYKGTKYCIKAIPFGGFVEMAGEDPDKATGGDGEYLTLAWYKKIWISFAGPFSNYILAIVFFAAIFNIWGVAQTSPLSQIGATIENYPAQTAGLLADDIIKTINGTDIQTWNDLSENLKDKAGKDIKFVVERGSYTFKLNMVVATNPVTQYGVLGITPKIIKREAGFFESIEFGAKTTIIQTVMTVSYLIDKIVTLEKPDISGPIGVMQVIAKATKNGFEDYLTLLGIISVALGMFNLFPIPMVDGGMIVLFLIEGISRRKISLKVVQVYNMIGLVLIAGIFVFATYSDLIRLGIGKLFGGG